MTRPRAGHERQSGVRRAEVHLQPARQDRGDRQPHRQARISTVDVEVDGGIDPETAAQAIGAGATALVAGTAAFRGGPSAYANNIKALRGGA